MDDDNSSTTGTEFTTTSTAVSVASEPFNFNSPLYRPIPLPATVVSYSDDATTKPTDTEPDEAEHYKIIEEDRTSAQVHAACRLHEAVLVLTSAIETLITRCSGLSLPEAAAACRIYNANNNYSSLKSQTNAAPDGRYAAEKGHQRAMMLVNLRKTLLAMTEGTSTLVRAAMEVRDYAVAHGLLLPLSMLETVDITGTRATFSAFLQRDTCDLANDQDTSRLCGIISENRYPLDCLLYATWAKSLGRLHVVLFVSDCHGQKGLHAIGLPYEIRHAGNYTGPANNAIAAAANYKKNGGQSGGSRGSRGVKGKDEFARAKVNNMITRLVSLAVKNTASHAKYLAMATEKVMQWQRPSRGVVSQVTMWTTGRRRGRRPQDDDDELLWQVLAACEQAVAASEAAIRPFMRQERLA